MYNNYSCVKVIFNKFLLTKNDQYELLFTSDKDVLIRCASDNISEGNLMVLLDLLKDAKISEKKNQEMYLIHSTIHFRFCGLVILDTDFENITTLWLSDEYKDSYDDIKKAAISCILFKRYSKVINQFSQQLKAKVEHYRQTVKSDYEDTQKAINNYLKNSNNNKYDHGYNEFKFN